MPLNAVGMYKNQITLKLGNRLRQLERMIDQRYSQIWDCCCDHGLLGMSLLQRHAAVKVIFVDILSKQMALLESKLSQYFSRDEFDWEIVCKDLKDIKVPDDSSQLFIIAGVGGDKTIEFINSLCISSSMPNFDLLVCSVHGNYQVRETLANQGFYLVNEQIVMENNRFYEVIYASPKAKQTITKVGDSMWDWSNHEHINYWQKMIAYYRIKTKTNAVRYKSILEDYEKLNNGAD